MSEWRTIDSAPRDGTRILLGGMASGPPVDTGYWGAARHLGRKAGYERAFVTSPSSGDVKPTHWMPLPEPPSKDEGSGG